MRDYMANQMIESNSNGPCFLVSSLPDELANPDSLSNLFGYYGDVHRIKMLRNKPDCALVQMAKPHQAAMCKKYLGKLFLFQFVNSNGSHLMAVTLKIYFSYIILVKPKRVLGAA